MQPVSRRVPLVFRKALRRAVYSAWRQNKITGSDAYVLLDVIQGSQRGGRYYRKPHLMVDAEQHCRKELVVHDAESAETGDIDWGHWIDLLVEWLPVILKIFLTILVFAEPPANEPSESSKITPPFVDEG